MIGGMERASFGDKGLHYLVDCGLVMQHPVKLFGGLDLDEEDNDDERRESDSSRSGEAEEKGSEEEGIEEDY